MIFKMLWIKNKRQKINMQSDRTQQNFSDEQQCPIHPIRNGSPKGVTGHDSL